MPCGRAKACLIFLQQLLKHNGKVYIAGRSQAKAEDGMKRLKAETGEDAFFVALDLSDLKSVKAAADHYMRFVWLAAQRIPNT